MSTQAEMLKSEASELTRMPEPTRFAWAISGSTADRHPTADRDLDVLPECVVAPSVGAIVPGWLLLIPRKPTLSMRDLPHAERRAILYRARAVAEVIRATNKNVAIFEHGPSRRGSIAGCGIDQAHIHVVALPFDLANHTRMLYPEHAWTNVCPDDPWSRITPNADYYLMSGEAGLFISEPTDVLSQFFRRVIAEAVGRTDEWDYRQHPNDRNIRATIDLYTPSLLRAA